MSLTHPSDPGFLFQRDIWVGLETCPTSILASSSAITPGQASTLAITPPNVGTPLVWSIPSVTGSAVATITGNGNSAVLDVDPASGGGTVTVQASDPADPACFAETTLTVATLEVSSDPLLAGVPAVARLAPMPPGLALEWDMAPHTDPNLARNADARINPSSSGVSNCCT